MPLKLNGYTAHICCEGTELETYGVQVEGTKVTCWIASKAGEAFTVHWGDESCAAIMRVQVKMDGRLVDSLAHQSSNANLSEGVDETPGCRRPYRFAPLVLTDDEGVASSKAKLNQDLGTIEVIMTKVDYFTKSTNHFSMGAVSEIGPVHERSKKAGVHAVALGEIQVCAPRTSLTSHGVSSVPFATFRFQYRPLALLQANDIAPPPPPSRPKKRPSNMAAGSSNSKRRRTAVGTQSNDTIDGDDEDEDEDADRVTFLQEQIIMLQGRLAQEQAKKRPLNPVKREASPIIVIGEDPDDIIDLTVDDP